MGKRPGAPALVLAALLIGATATGGNAGELPSTPSPHTGSQHSHGQADTHRSPYADGFDPDTDIRSLPADGVAAILAGKGAGYALPAELNGLPGPRHVLDLAGELSLTADQRRRVETIHRRMEGGAVAAGARYLAALAAFEADLRTGNVAEADLPARVADLGRLEADVASAHLLAHLQTAAVLDRDQRQEYDRLRGYESDAPGG